MSILIKAMEMPRTCEECPFCDETWAICLAFNEKHTASTRYSERMSWCPLLPLTKSTDTIIDGNYEDSDVKPVVHGHWQRYNPLTDTEECSICHYNIINEEFETPYCPMCGARMVEE